MSPLTIAALVVVAIVTIVVASGVFGDIARERFKLTREQRRREDIARAQARSDAKEQEAIDIASAFADPLHLFH